MINDNEHGQVILVAGEQWVGLISLSYKLWLAYKIGDPSRAIHYVEEDA